MTNSQELATLPGRDQQSITVPTVESQLYEAKPYPIVLIQYIPTKAHGHLGQYRGGDLLVAQDPPSKHCLRQGISKYQQGIP
jgi:hypothetical protein